MNKKIVKFTNDDNFSKYSLEISDKFCPYLKPAEKNNVLHLTEYKLSGNHMEELQEEIFYYGVIHTEELRRFRQNNKNSPKGILICENLKFISPPMFNEIDGEELFSWPHWLLKILYTKSGVMFGKFWIGEKTISRSGDKIPEPPCHFLSIRSVIKERDPYFFSKAPELLPQLIHSIDNGENVHTPLLPAGCDIFSMESMKKYKYFSIVLCWAQEQLNRKAEQST
ncbi:hypothetical protein [Bacillus cereus]|uniref:Uncharacterized protein n=1 Tax=Bacillus cereus HuA3-9 TaxID=1053205 RepID=R8CAU3_BACCE|nr:hypothetical protein [Bacillus cereus]EOO08756.1 hypothetical protein IGA_06330 [Bacillus cereus HuA3-9]